MTQRPPKDNLYRAMAGGATSTDGKTLTVRLAAAGQWAEIDSHSEGHFMERFAPSAYRKTMAEHLPKILFQHGKDPQVGEKPISTTDEVGEDEISPFVRGQVLDGVPELIVDGLRKGVYGASHRFSVIREDWNDKPAGGPHNPNRIPERTITEARLFELGPVTWPAYATATAALRSITDEMRGITPSPAPSLAAEAAPHREPERRDPTKNANKEIATVEYVTREDKAARKSEVEQALERMSTETPGVLPAPLQADWDLLVEERETLTADIKAWDDRRAIVQQFAERGNVEQTAPQFIVRKTDGDIYNPEQYNGYSVEQRSQKLRDNAMRSVETSRFEHPNAEKRDAEIRGHVQYLLDNKDTEQGEIAQRVLKTGSPQYKRYFQKKIAGKALTPEEIRYAALQVVGTTTTGGDAIPYTFDPTFIPTGAYTNINPYRGICRVEQIAGSNRWEGVSVGAVLAAYDAESAATTEGGPTFARPYLVAQRASSFVTLSRETLQDRPDIASELAVLIGEAKDTLEENQFSIGVGSTVYPLGMFVKSTFTVKETITDNTFAVADLFATEAALPIRHRRDAVWMLSRAVIRIIEGWETAYGQLFNSTVGYPAVGGINNNPGGNTGKMLLGYPVYETPSAPATVTSDDTIVGILVAPKNYLILDRIGMDLEVVPNMFDATTGFPNGNRGVLAIWRNTADTVNADAGRQININ